MPPNAATGSRIFLIDDHPAVRQGLAMLLAHDGHHVCGEAASRQETLLRIAAADADLALLDLMLGGENGLDLIDDLHRHGVAVLVYSMHEDAYTVGQVYARGADGYVSKREVADELLKAVSTVLAGRRHVSPLAALSLAGSVIAARTSVSEVPLSEREQQILRMLGQGCGNQEIGEKLMISVRTVESYCARAIDKLGLDGMKELRRLAIRRLRREDIPLQ